MLLKTLKVPDPVSEELRWANTNCWTLRAPPWACTLRWVVGFVQLLNWFWPYCCFLHISPQKRKLCFTFQSRRCSYDPIHPESVILGYQLTRFCTDKEGNCSGGIGPDRRAADLSQEPQEAAAEPGPP